MWKVYDVDDEVNRRQDGTSILAETMRVHVANSVKQTDRTYAWEAGRPGMTPSWWLIRTRGDEKLGRIADSYLTDWLDLVRKAYLEQSP